MKILKNIGLLILSLAVPYFFSENFLSLYQYFWPPQSTDGFFAAYSALADVMIGFFIGFIFSPIVLFTALGDNQKYWWTGILLLPAVWFVVKFDLAHWWFYVLLAFAGWLIGFGINRLWSNLRRQKNPLGS